jgi:hypothetical protein
MGRAVVCSVSHDQLMRTFAERSTIGFAVWRETLIDAAIFRESITNNSSRHGTARIAHFLCEQFHRAKFAGLVEANACPLPVIHVLKKKPLGVRPVAWIVKREVLPGTRLQGAISGHDALENYRGGFGSIALPDEFFADREFPDFGTQAADRGHVGGVNGEWYLSFRRITSLGAIFLALTDIHQRARPVSVLCQMIKHEHGCPAITKGLIQWVRHANSSLPRWGTVRP